MTHRQQAAVAVVVRRPDPGHVLLVRRAESAHDPWSGDVAFPGGRRDASDSDLEATAIRETLEETGLDLSACGHALGLLTPVSPISRHLPPLTVTPFSFVVQSAASARPASPEIASVHWVPLAELAQPQTRSTLRVATEGGRSPHLTYPCYRVGELVIWGLTYRILSRFVEGLGDRVPSG